MAGRHSPHAGRARSPEKSLKIGSYVEDPYKYAVGITQFFRRRGTVGCFDQISLRDFHCSKAPDPSDDPRGHRRVLPLVWCEEATRTGTLSIHGMHRDEQQLATPCIAIDRGASVGCLMVDHLTCRNGTGDSLPIISNNGHIGRLVAGNLHGVAGSGPIALFDRTASGIIGSREIGACDGMDATGAICADLPDFLQPGEGLAMRDYTVSNRAFSGGVPVLADAEADEGRAFVVPAGEGALVVSARSHPADQRDSQALDSKELMVNEGGYVWLACGESNFYFRDEEIAVTFGAGASDSLTLRMDCGVADRYRLWARVKAGRSESGQRVFFVARAVLEQLAPWREAHPLLNLNDGWQFKKDPKKTGEQEKWFASGPDAAWQPISIAAPWTMQGHNHNGAAWYGNSFSLPGRPEDGPVWLVFHAVDGSARVWINGKEAGAQERTVDMWHRPWALDVGPLTKGGGSFQIVMRVEKDLYDAGIFKPVELRAGKNG